VRCRRLLEALVAAPDYQDVKKRLVKVVVTKAEQLAAGPEAASTAPPDASNSLPLRQPATVKKCV
jgi:hypothetical protein